MTLPTLANRTPIRAQPAAPRLVRLCLYLCVFVFVFALDLAGVSGHAFAKQGYKEAPTRRVESKTNNPYCEDAKRAFRVCYIPCVKAGHKSIGHVTNHCNVACNNELVWVNYLCRPDPYLPFTN